MQEIVNGILTWAWFSEPHGYDFNGHLIRDPGGNICVDPVEPTEDDLHAIAREGVSRIILTNRNHSRASNRLRARTEARTAIHSDDADHAQSQGTELDDALVVGGRIGPLEIIDASGKSPGEVALFWPDRGILIVGGRDHRQPAGPVRAFAGTRNGRPRSGFGAMWAGFWISTSTPFFLATASLCFKMPRPGSKIWLRRSRISSLGELSPLPACLPHECRHRAVTKPVYSSDIVPSTVPRQRL